MRLSFISWIACAILLIISGSFFYPRWKNQSTEAQLSWDAGGYYWYLPSAFIYHDLKGQHFKDSILHQYSPTPPEDFQYGYQHSSGNYVIRYTLGTALLEAPFFFIAHIVAKPLGYPADGFSRPYQFMIYLGGILFALLGLWYLRKLLLHYYSDKVTAIVLLLLVFGTNYLNYAGIDTGMTHGWLFTMYVLILWNTHLYYHTLRKKYILWVGALIGLTALIRPPEIISVLIPLLWGMEKISKKAFADKFLFLKKHIQPITAAAAIGLLIISLQFIYWKYATGEWFVYTYQNQGFSWLAPHFKQYSLNYQSGWLIYTPMMFLVFPALITFIRFGKNKIAILTLIVINYYIVAAWDLWEYGGRAMVQNYPLLLLVIASFIQYLLEKKWRFVIGLPFLLVFAYFNIWWTYQAHKGTIIGSVPATSAYYWNTIFRYNVPIELQKLRDNKDLYLKEVKEPVTLYTSQSRTDSRLPATIVNDHQESFSIEAPTKKYKWIRASTDFHIDQKEWNVWFMTLFTLRFKKGNEIIRENNIRIQRFLNDNETKNITIDAKVRSDDYDHIELVFRNDNNGSLPCVIDNIKVIGFNN